MMTQHLINFGLGAVLAAAFLHVASTALERLHPSGQPVTLGDLIARSLVGGR